MITHVSANETAQRLTGRDYVSWSALSTYRQCPLRYYFRYVRRLPEPVVSASLAFGGALHAAIELHFRELLAGNSPPDQDMLLGAFWEEWNNRSETTIEFGKNEDLNSIAHLADRTIAAFRTSEFARPSGRILGVEEELRGQLVEGMPELLAKLDLVVETDDSLVVTDFKSARSRWSPGQAEISGEQLLLYADLAKELAPAKQLRLEFVVITKAKAPQIDRLSVSSDRARVRRIQRVAENVWQAISSERFYPAPSAMNCAGCPFTAPCQEWGR
jgi:putative RecB family exonuclease